jgi:hypothetical protein
MRVITMRTHIETTNRVNDMLEQGGICGRVVTYDAAEIAKIMRCTIAEAADMTGTELVPGYDCMTLAEIIDYQGLIGHVVCKGTVIV